MKPIFYIIITFFLILLGLTSLHAHEYKVNDYPSPERYNGLSAPKNPMKRVKQVISNCRIQKKVMAYNDYSKYSKGQRKSYGKLECIQVAGRNTDENQ